MGFDFGAMLKRTRENLQEHDRYLPFSDCTKDRWELSEFFGFGPGTSIYPSARLYGLSKLKVGSNVWIGPKVLLDATGGLLIGKWCSISSGVEIYSHSTVRSALTGGKHKYEYEMTEIGNRCFVGPGAVILYGTNLGPETVVRPNAVVSGAFPRGVILDGSPAKVVGTVEIDREEGLVGFHFNKEEQK